MPTDYPPLSKRDQARWAKKIEPGPNGCVLWTARTNAKGYGSFRLGTRVLLAHRVAYVQAYGQIPDGLQVCHTCDTPACVEPAHLKLGTAADNAHDKVERERAKGINAAGTNGRAKLDWPQVDEIRRRLTAGESGAFLAEAFDVTGQQISQIRLGRTWKKPAIEVVPKKPRSDRGKRKKPMRTDGELKVNEKTAQRFWAKVNKGSAVDRLSDLGDPRDACWLWTAATTPGGYGAFNVDGRVRVAHRIAYLIEHGEIPDADIAHSCANRLCVNPAHLAPENRAANMANEHTRARIATKNKGNRNRAVLTDEQIRYVKERFRDEPMLSAVQIARELGDIVTPAALAKIRKGQSGAHVRVAGFEPRRVSPKEVAAMRNSGEELSSPAMS